MSVATKPVTADELLKMPANGLRYELIRGELREMSPAGYKHGKIANRFATFLSNYVWENDLGEVFAAKTGFKLAANPDTVRAPDAAFVRKARLALTAEEEGFWPGAPDLAAEVISPGDSYSDVDEKVNNWLDAGTQMVLVINPRNRTVTLYRSRDDIRLLTENDVIEGGDVLPGWQLPVKKLFD